MLRIEVISKEKNTGVTSISYKRKGYMFLVILRDVRDFLIPGNVEVNNSAFLTIMREKVNNIQTFSMRRVSCPFSNRYILEIDLSTNWKSTWLLEVKMNCLSGPQKLFIYYTCISLQTVTVLESA